MPLDDSTIRRYLLGELAGGERDALEAQYFAEAEVFEAIEAIEDELVRDYLDGRLDPTERARMERHYLANPVHRTRVAVARNLRRRAQRRSWVFPAAAAATVLVALVGAALLWPRDTGDAVATPPMASIPRSPDAPAVEPAPRPVFALTLPAIALRSGGETPTVRPGAGPADIVLALERGDVGARGPFEVILRTVEGEVVWRGPADRPEGADGAGLIARVTVPAEKLPPNDYVVVLAPSGARYTFRVAP